MAFRCGDEHLGATSQDISRLSPFWRVCFFQPPNLRVSTRGKTPVPGNIPEDAFLLRAVVALGMARFHVEAGLLDIIKN